MPDDDLHRIRLLHTVDHFSRLKAYSGIAPRRLLVVDEELVDAMVRDHLLEARSAASGRRGCLVQGLALTQEGRQHLLPRP